MKHFIMVISPLADNQPRIVDRVAIGPDTIRVSHRRSQDQSLSVINAIEIWVNTMSYVCAIQPKKLDYFVEAGCRTEWTEL